LWETGEESSSTVAFSAANWAKPGERAEADALAIEKLTDVQWTYILDAIDDELGPSVKRATKRAAKRGPSALQLTKSARANLHYDKDDGKKIRSITVSYTDRFLIDSDSEQEESVEEVDIGSGHEDGNGEEEGE
jgi:hypothetical protein